MRGSAERRVSYGDSLNPRSAQLADPDVDGCASLLRGAYGRACVQDPAGREARSAHAGDLSEFEVRLQRGFRLTERLISQDGHSVLRGLRPQLRTRWSSS
jgi:hypothetical protein